METFYIRERRLATDRGSRALRMNTGHTAKRPSSNLRRAVKAFEKEFIRGVLDRNGWNRGKTAAQLGIGVKTLYRKMKEYGFLSTGEKKSVKNDRKK